MTGRREKEDIEVNSVTSVYRTVVVCSFICKVALARRQRNDLFSVFSQAATCLSAFPRTQRANLPS